MEKPTEQLLCRVSIPAEVVHGNLYLQSHKKGRRLHVSSPFIRYSQRVINGEGGGAGDFKKTVGGATGLEPAPGGRNSRDSPTRPCKAIFQLAQKSNSNFWKNSPRNSRDSHLRNFKKQFFNSLRKATQTFGKLAA